MCTAAAASISYPEPNAPGSQMVQWRSGKRRPTNLNRYPTGGKRDLFRLPIIRRAQVLVLAVLFTIPFCAYMVVSLLRTFLRAFYIPPKSSRTSVVSTRVYNFFSDRLAVEFVISVLAASYVIRRPLYQNISKGLISGRLETWTWSSDDWSSGHKFPLNGRTCLS